MSTPYRIPAQVPLAAPAAPSPYRVTTYRPFHDDFPTTIWWTRWWVLAWAYAYVYAWTHYGQPVWVRAPPDRSPG